MSVGRSGGVIYVLSVRSKGPKRLKIATDARVDSEEMPKEYSWTPVPYIESAKLVPGGINQKSSFR